MVPRLIYGCGDCGCWFVIPHVCVYGTWACFLHLICRQMDNMVWQGLFRCLLFPAQSMMECNCQECKVKPWVQRPFPVSVFDISGPMSLPNSIYRDMAFLSIGKVWCVDMYIKKLDVLFWKRREEISGSSLRDSSSPQTPAPLHRSLIKDSHCPRAVPLFTGGPSRFVLNTYMHYSKWTQLSSPQDTDKTVDSKVPASWHSPVFER